MKTDLDQPELVDGGNMRTLTLAIIFSCLFFGCARKPMVIKYYPPVTQDELDRGRGSLKELDYRKPHGTVTIFGISVF